MLTREGNERLTTVTIQANDRYATSLLKSGRVKVEGFDVRVETPTPTVAAVFNDFLHNLRYEAVDLPLSNYIIARDLGKPVTAVPVFPTMFFPIFGPRGAQRRPGGLSRPGPRPAGRLRPGLA